MPTMQRAVRCVQQMSDMYLTRRIFTNKSTIGKLIINDSEFWCLEDTARKIKINGETCIPSGSYEVEIRKSGRFGRPMPYLKNVPYYEGIMIHPGNSNADTNGCLLVGMCHPSADFIGESKIAFDKLFPLIEASLREGPLKIHIAGGYTKEEFEASLKSPPQYS